MIREIYFQFNINNFSNVSAKKTTRIIKWLTLKSMGLGESELDDDGGNDQMMMVEMFFKFEVDICMSSNVMGQVHKNLQKSFGCWWLQ